MTLTQIAIFRGKNIRKTIYKNEWWFVINDVIVALTDSSDPAQYFKKMKSRDKELAKLISKGGVQLVPPLMLEFPTLGGKQKMYSWSTEGILRLVQSIPSPKAEPFKRWLARVGYERVQEIENPELATKRTRFLYKAKGYPNSWIEKRMRGINIREELTDEWRNREIITEMDGLELIFSMLGEASTTRITTAKNAIGFRRNEKTAREGGKIAGDARRALEKKSGKKVSTRQNYLKGYKERKLIST